MLKNLIRLCTYLVATLMWVAPLAAFESGFTETEGAIRTWRTASGLPADSVAAILQTREGYLWVGTSAGLVRFDGDKFTELRLGVNGTNSPIRITALCEDSRGNLWIGTQQQGVFELVHGAITHYTKTNGLLDDNITSLAASSNGFVWIGTKAGLNLATEQGINSFTVKDGLPDELVSGVHVARSGAVWITTRAGMCRYVDGHIAPYEFPTESQGRSPEYLGAYEDRRGNMWVYGDTYLINLTENRRFNYFRGNDSRIWSMCEGYDGRLWIGTSGRGLYCFDDNRFQQVALGESRTPHDVRAVFEDRDRNLWLGTRDGGLVQLRPQPIHVMRPGQGLPASPPTALALDNNGRIYVGLQRGGLFVGESGRFEPFASAGGLDVHHFVTSLFVSREGTVWTGTLDGGLYGLRSGRGVRYTTANGLVDDAVLATCADADGNVWASTSAGTLHCFTATNVTRFDVASVFPRSPPGGAVTTMIPAMTGGLWLGTDNGAILREEKGKFRVIQTGEKVGRRPVLALHESEDDQIWIGTPGGLACWSRGTRASWTTGNGLPNDYIAGIVTDTAKNLWLATSAGIYRTSHATLQRCVGDPQAQFTSKLMSDARTASESSTIFGGVRALLSGDGKLWFATSEGVLTVDTKRPEIESAVIPVYIEKATFNSNAPVSILQNVAWAPEFPNKAALMTLSDLRVLVIDYTALSFSTPEKTRFRHKLEGADADWVEDGGQRSAKYTLLPYGRYVFRVAARNADGPWQEAANSFAFEVPTPLYLQGWAIALYGMAAIAVVTGIVRVVSHRRLRATLAQLEQQQSLERERMRIARDMHDEIGSKLTKISFLSEHARVDAQAEGRLAGKIESIAETSRDLLQTMDEIVWVVNPRNDSLEHLAAYLSHYADEYFQNTSVDCELRLPPAIPHIPLSSETRHNLFLAFEETLNNVLKHSEATKVKVEMVVNPPKFEITITDNGKGFVASPTAANGQPQSSRGGRGGNGLRNIRQRLADIAGECAIRSQPGIGTTVSLFIRLQPGTGKKS